MVVPPWRDYAFGHQSEKDVTEVVNTGGGKVLGTSRHPLADVFSRAKR